MFLIARVVFVYSLLLLYLYLFIIIIYIGFFTHTHTRTYIRHHARAHTPLLRQYATLFFTPERVFFFFPSFLILTLIIIKSVCVSRTLFFFFFFFRSQYLFIHFFLTHSHPHAKSFRRVRPPPYSPQYRTYPTTL
ncbi:unnamed protein product [Aphis gossypii]|uniref:Uncharacterized protein n=1 Tax=Aphis gossypii TaxID=80765 RepID=A0A9P0JD84_APHGO|nr:unnamed protein product [Aphis gossypii]